ncbi:MAG: hypothetical protein WCF84_22040 [Anaerolineae bacterium]
MNEASETPQEPMSDLLRTRGDRLPRAWWRLADALWNEQDKSLSHEECRAAMAEYIEAEVADDPVGELYPEVKHHLDRCDACAKEYADLLDSALAEERGQLPRLQSIPSPDLSFLRKRAPEPAARPQSDPQLSLQTTVLKWTRDLLATRDPQRVRELSVIADTFFERVTGLSRFELQMGAIRTLGVGRRDAGEVLTTLAACYATTQALKEQVTAEQAEAWSRQKTLSQEIQAHADSVARQVGLDRKAAQEFARAYAAAVTRDQAALEALLKPS